MVRNEIESPTPRDPFYGCSARDLPMVRRVDPPRVRRETWTDQSPPPLAPRLCGDLQRDGSPHAAAARSQARPRCLRAVPRGHLPAAPRIQGAWHVGSDAEEGVRAAALALGTRPQASADRRWHPRSFESANALRSVSSQEKRTRAQRASGANARAQCVGGRRVGIGGWRASGFSWAGGQAPTARRSSFPSITGGHQ